MTAAPAAIPRDPANLIPGVLLYGHPDKPEGAPVYGRLNADGTVGLRTCYTSDTYVLRHLRDMAAHHYTCALTAGPGYYDGVAAIVAWARTRARETHRQDADCAGFVSKDDFACVACGVAHAEDPEPCCGAHGFHRPGCELVS